MRPFTRKPPVTQVISIVGGVNDNGIIRQTLRLKSLDEPADGVIDSTNHTQVSPHIGSILGFSIPTPKETFTVNGGLKEIRLVLKNFGII